MIAFKKEDPVLKRSNRILTGVENRLSLFSTALNTGFATFSEPKTAVNSRF